MSFSELKEDAKKSLKGKYSDAIIMIIVYGLIAGAIAGICGYIDGALGLTQEQTIVMFGQELKSTNPGIFTALSSIVITCLFYFGMLSFYYKVSKNEKVTWKEMFGKMNMFLDFFVISLLVSIFTTLWSILFIIPGIIASFAYSQVYLVKLNDPDLGYMEAIKKSKEIMKGHKMEYFLLNLSFIGWILLGVLTCGILYFWLMPYMSVTQCNFYNKITKK